MKKLRIPLITAISISTLASAQDQDVVLKSNLKKHQVSGPVAECMTALSRDCILTASLSTVVDETQAIERIKVLSAVALGLAETGDMTRAERPLAAAREELESIRFSFVQKMKQAEIAPIYAYMGKREDVLSLTKDLSSIVRGRTLEECIYMAALVGRSDDVLAYINALTLYAQRRPYILTDAAEMLALSGDPSVVITALLVDENFRSRPSLMVRAAHIKTVAADVRAGLLRDAEDEMKARFGMFQRVRYAAANRALGDQADAENLKSFEDVGKELRGGDDKRAMALDMARTYVSIGMVDKAISQTYYFKTADEQANYLMRVSRLPQATNAILTSGAYAQAVTDVLSETLKLESAMERDMVRLKLLDGARRITNLEIAIKIVKSLEDDDTAAKGLALLLPLLKS